MNPKKETSNLRPRSDFGPMYVSSLSSCRTPPPTLGHPCPGPLYPERWALIYSDEAYLL